MLRSISTTVRFEKDFNKQSKFYESKLKKNYPELNKYRRHELFNYEKKIDFKLLKESENLKLQEKF